MKVHKNKSSRTIASVLRAEFLNRPIHVTAKLDRYTQRFNRSLLPTPASYYNKEFPGLKIKSEWVKIKCCFHQPDNHPSLSISMVNGHFRCFSCGAKGCDVVAFHMLRYKISFINTITFMGAWRYE